MKASPSSPQRCAIYTRKSTEHNLDLAFNSLDAQREACEAYIKSQAHEGWSLVPDRFDDGGLSGASLDRPALQDLLGKVRARAIDIVVVYKVDRLTRSLADFAKLVELFDAHGVSFVSVTQSFNTTSSMGRLTLNVLLSFAQFEREVIGERVRDKIAASKRRGLWVGGTVPLGYRSIDKKLAVVEQDADLVRKIFADYLRLGSIAELAASLHAEGIRPKGRRRPDGSTTTPERFLVGPLAHILKNRFYVGEIFFRNEVHQGEHAAIVDRSLFDAVQARLAEGIVRRRVARSQSPSLLAGKIVDDAGCAMSPSHATKKGVRYRYYVSQALLQGRRDEAGSVARVSAPDVEALVLAALHSHAAEDAGLDDRELIETHVERVTVSKGRIAIALRQQDSASSTDAPRSADPPPLIEVPFKPSGPMRKGLAHSPDASASISPRDRDLLLRAIGRARNWVDSVEAGRTTFDAIAATEGLVERHVRRLAPLAYLAPSIVKAIANGTAPAGLTISSLTQALPHAWA
ncbi:MAG: recombinase family protein, partial [Microcystis sp. LE19-12.2C]|nr:recombinase family protein [Microcystis sp. LE19-12.2C]